MILARERDRIAARATRPRLESFWQGNVRKESETESDEET